MPKPTEADAVLNTRTKRLDGLSYKLGTSQFGLDAVLATEELPPPDESRMCCWVPYADGNRRDGVGDLLEVSGIDLSRHRLNPLHLFDHGKQVAFPIGTVQDPTSGQYTGVIDPVTKSARDLVFYYQDHGNKGHAEFCEQLFDLWCKKFIRAGSIGYAVKQAQPLQADYGTGVPQGLHLLSVLKLESSTVVLPANGDTVRKMLALPKVCGRPLSPYLVKSLEPYMPEKKAVVVGGWGQKGTQHGGRGGGKVPNRYDPLTDPIKAGDTVTAREYLQNAQGRSVVKPGTKLKVVSDAGAELELETADGVRVRGHRSQLRKQTTASPTSRGSRESPHATREGPKDSGGASYLNNKPGRQPKGDQESYFARCDRDDRGHCKGTDMAHTKALPDEVSKEDAAAEADAPPPGEEAYDFTKEKWGAQMARRFHQDHKLLMKDYEEMLGSLEEPDLQGHFGEYMKYVGGAMKGLGKLFKKKYKDYPPLDKDELSDADVDPEDDNDGELAETSKEDGAAEPGPAPDEDGVPGADTTDDAVGAGSDPDREENEPSADEVVAGMDAAREEDAANEFHKGKRLSGKMRRKGICPGCGKEGCACQAGKVGQKLGPVAAAAIGATAATVLGDDDKGCGMPHKGFAPHRLKALRAAAAFLKALGEDGSDLGNEGQFKSYHYHKQVDDTLEEAHDDLAQVPPETDVPPSDFEPGVGAKAIPVGRDWVEEEGPEPEHKALLRGVSKFFAGLAREKAFGDPHREQAKHWAKKLQDLVGHQEGVQEMNLVGENEPLATGEAGPEVDPTRVKAHATNPGELGEKAYTVLFEQARADAKRLAELQTKLAKLAG